MIYVNGNQVMETEYFVPEIKNYSSNILGCALVDEKGNLLS